MNADGKGAREETDISDFADILVSGDDSDPPVVVGGHAVNMWSHYYMHKGMSELSRYLPFTSKDLDLVGSAGLLERIHLQTKGNLRRSEPRSPVLGRIEVPRSGGGVLLVEVLHTVKGLSFKELGRTMDLVVDNLKARVLLPHLVLKAKIENATDIDQEGRNDVKHVRMMILCMRACVAELGRFVSEGKVSERALVNVLEETFAIISSPKAEKAASLWGFDFREVWPIEELRTSGSEKVARWVEHRLA